MVDAWLVTNTYSMRTRRINPRKDIFTFQDWDNLEFTVDPPKLLINVTALPMRTGGIRIHDHPK